MTDYKVFDIIRCADGHLYLHGENGEVALVEATPEGYHVIPFHWDEISRRVLVKVETVQRLFYLCDCEPPPATTLAQGGLAGVIQLLCQVSVQSCFRGTTAAWPSTKPRFIAPTKGVPAGTLRGAAPADL